MLFNFFVIDLVVVAIRIGVALASNSMAMYTTAARAAISILTAFIAWVSMRFASKDENDRFNYGYGKLESISSTVKGVALLISFFIIVFVAIGRLSHPERLTPVGAEIAIAFSFFFTCGNILRWSRIRRVLAKGDRSPVLWSQYKATNASIIVNAGSFISVLLSVLLAGFWFGPYIDPVMSILLSGFILVFAYSILSSSMTDLLDRTLDESMQMLIVRALAEFFDEYTQILAVRSRRSGGIIFVEIVLEFEVSRSMGEVQAVVDRMQKSLEMKIPDSRITIIPRSSVAMPLP
jgi:ferrous-iron efflux pump FieF